MSTSKENLDFNEGSSSSSHRLLSDDEDYSPEDARLTHKKPRVWLKAVFVHTLIFSIYTFGFLAMYKNIKGQNCHPDLIYSPARDALKYELVKANNDIGKKSPYSGFPSPEGDAAWRDLLKNSNIRITGEELKKMNKTSIQLQDGSGDFFGGLSAHHHLHCLKSARRVIWRDYYELPEEPYMWAHLDHCLEDLRQSLMCNADYSVITYDWLPNFRRPWANFKVDNECVNWEQLDSWAGERFFSLFDQKALVHPDLGISYPIIDGKLPLESTLHPQPADIESLKLGTNPKDKIYEAPKGSGSRFSS